MSINVKSCVAIHPAPAGVPSLDDYYVEVEGKPLPVYSTRVNLVPNYFVEGTRDNPPTENTGVACFDFHGSVKVTIAYLKGLLSSVNIRPKRYQIQPKIEGSRTSFTITKPGKISVEFNGSLHGALHLFADSMETNLPNVSDPNVLYFGPGLHQAGIVHLKNNQLVYLAGGAVVRGVISGNGITGAKVLGHGILDGSQVTNGAPMILLKNCSDIEVNGIIVLDSDRWSIVTHNARHIRFENIKQVCGRHNSDGFDICSSQNVTIHNCFTRNWDDCIVLKAYNQDDRNSTRDIIVSDCIIWCDLANCLEIGYELMTASVENVLFKNCDLIHSLGSDPKYNSCISIHNSDAADVHNIRYQDICIEDARSTTIFNMFVKVEYTTKDKERGRIRDISFKNIDIATTTFPCSRFEGFDDDHAIENITFDNVRVNGKLMTKPEDLKIEANEFVRDLKFLASP